MKKQFLFLLSVLLFCGCEDMFDIHPYDARITGETNINTKNIARIEQACAGKTTIRFVLTGDTQNAYDETEDLVKALNKRNDIDFVLHGGDMTDYGLTKEFEWGRNVMEKLKVPYVALIGNHDCVGTGKHVYQKMFGDENFAFLAGNVKFICLNTNAIEYDYSQSIPDFNFIKAQLKEQRQGHEKTIMAMHVPPYNDQFNNNVADIFQYIIKEFPKLQFCVNGHNHVFSAQDYGNGVIYYCYPHVKRRNYLLFTITPDDNYSYETVEF